MTGDVDHEGYEAPAVVNLGRVADLTLNGYGGAGATNQHTGFFNGPDLNYGSFTSS